MDESEDAPPAARGRWKQMGLGSGVAVLVIAIAALGSSGSDGKLEASVADAFGAAKATCHPFAPLRSDDVLECDVDDETIYVEDHTDIDSGIDDVTDQVERAQSLDAQLGMGISDAFTRVQTECAMGQGECPDDL